MLPSQNIRRTYVGPNGMIDVQEGPERDFTREPRTKWQNAARRQKAAALQRMYGDNDEDGNDDDDNEGDNEGDNDGGDDAKYVVHASIFFGHVLGLANLFIGPGRTDLTLVSL